MKFFFAKGGGVSPYFLLICIPTSNSTKVNVHLVSINSQCRIQSTIYCEGGGLKLLKSMGFSFFFFFFFARALKIPQNFSFWVLGGENKIFFKFMTILRVLSRSKIQIKIPYFHIFLHFIPLPTSTYLCSNFCHF